MKKIFLITIIFLSFTFMAEPQSSVWQEIAFDGQEVYQIAFDRQNNLYAVAGNYFNPKLYKSTDYGFSWYVILSQSLCGNDSNFYFQLSNLVIDTTNIGFDKIYINRREMVQSSSCSDSLFLSTDGGNNWVRVPIPAQINSLAFNQNSKLYLKSDQNIYSTTNQGVIWDLVSSFGENRLIIDLEGNLYTNKTNFHPFSGPWEQIFKSTDNGANWIEEITSWNTGANFINFSSLPSGELFAGSFSKLYLKKNSASNWITNDGLTGPGQMLKNKFGYYYIFKGYGGVEPNFYSPDEGITWLPFDNNEIDVIWDLTIDSNGFLYAANYYNNNGGISKSIQSTFPIVNREVIDFTSTFVNDTSTFILKLFNPFQSQLVIDSINGISSPFSSQFTLPIILNLGDSSLIELNFNPHFSGDYKDTISIHSNLRKHKIYLNGAGKNPTSIDEDKLIFSFNLLQNYPNPFNPSTNIQYVVSNRQFVTLKVYDVLGKEIATLVNEEKSAGNYETVFNASHLASGIYYYQLRAGDYVETKQMILLK